MSGTYDIVSNAYLDDKNRYVDFYDIHEVTNASFETELAEDSKIFNMQFEESKDDLIQFFGTDTLPKGAKISGSFEYDEQSAFEIFPMILEQTLEKSVYIGNSASYNTDMKMKGDFKVEFDGKVKEISISFDMFRFMENLTIISINAPPVLIDVGTPGVIFENVSTDVIATYEFGFDGKVSDKHALDQQYDTEGETYVMTEEEFLVTKELTDDQILEYALRERFHYQKDDIIDYLKSFGKIGDAPTYEEYYYDGSESKDNNVMTIVAIIAIVIAVILAAVLVVRMRKDASS
jgi:hypothetical protein